MTAQNPNPEIQEKKCFLRTRRFTTGTVGLAKRTVGLTQPASGSQPACQAKRGGQGRRRASGPKLEAKNMSRPNIKIRLKQFWNGLLPAGPLEKEVNNIT